MVLFLIAHCSSFFCEIGSRLVDSPLCVVYGPVDVPYSKGFPTPKERSEDHLPDVEDAVVTATKRTASAGCEYHTVLEKQLRPR
jgi:hypothetical protein